MFFKRFVTPAAGVAAALLGPLTDVLWQALYPKVMDPLYPGLIVSAGVLLIVSMFTRKKTEVEVAVSH